MFFEMSEKCPLSIQGSWWEKCNCTVLCMGSVEHFTKSPGNGLGKPSQYFCLDTWPYAAFLGSGMWRMPQPSSLLDQHWTIVWCGCTCTLSM